MRNPSWLRSAGFTLLEMTIVVGVIGILAGLAVQSTQFATKESRATVCEKNRSLIEEEEQLFFIREGRVTESLDELVDQHYVTRVSCPCSGVLAWEEIDADLPFPHQSLVCSVHGRKTRIQGWETPGGPADVPTVFGADFEDGTFGGWATLGMATIVDASFGTSYAGDYMAYLDTNQSYNKVVARRMLANFLGVQQSLFNELNRKSYKGGTAMKIEASEGTKGKLRFNFLTQEKTPTWWFNDTAFLTVTNADTGRQEIYRLADTFASFTHSGTKFKEETGWLSLEDVGLGHVEIGAGDTVGIGVLNARSRTRSSGILIDEGP